MSDNHLMIARLIVKAVRGEPDTMKATNIIAKHLAEREAQAVQREREAADAAVERLIAILDWADIALAHPEHFNKGGVRNLTGPVFDKARAFAATYNDNRKG
jgi:hypothetical protein